MAAAPPHDNAQHSAELNDQIHDAIGGLRRVATVDSAKEPKPSDFDTKPPAGYLAELTAYGALDRAAQSVAAALADKLSAGAGASVCLVPDQQFLTSSWSATQLHSMLDRLENHLTTAQSAVQALNVVPAIGGFTDQGLQPATLPMPVSLPTAAGALADIARLLHSDLTMNTRALAKDKDALTSAVLGAVAGLPNVEAVTDDFQLITSDNPIAIRLNELHDARDILQALRESQYAKLIEPIHGQLADLEAEISDRQSSVSQCGATHDAVTHLAVLREQRRALRTAIAPAEALLARTASLVACVDAFLQSVASGNADTLPPALTAMLRNGFSTNGRSLSHLLHVRLDSIGADVVTRKWLWNPEVSPS